MSDVVLSLVQEQRPVDSMGPGLHATGHQLQSVGKTLPAERIRSRRLAKFVTLLKWPITIQRSHFWPDFSAGQHCSLVELRSGMRVVVAEWK